MSVIQGLSRRFILHVCACV